MVLLKSFKTAIREALTKAPSKEEIKRTIQQIHNEFDTSADKLVEEAQVILSKGLDEQKEQLARKLRNAGFTGTPLVSKVNKEIQVQTGTKSHVDTVLKYKQKYPQYKFIFEGQVKEICKKYGLVLGESHAYTGDIPVKNIEEIANFKVEPEDEYLSFTLRASSSRSFYSEISRFMSKAEVLKIKQGIREQYDKEPDGKKKPAFEQYYASHPHAYAYTKIPFYICAPLKDMKVEKDEVIKDNQIVRVVAVPDPIVLHFVPEGFLIVSKWGTEEEDEMLND